MDDRRVERIKEGYRFEVEARWVTGEWYAVRYYKRRYHAERFAMKYRDKRGERTRVRELTKDGE